MSDEQKKAIMKLQAGEPLRQSQDGELIGEREYNSEILRRQAETYRRLLDEAHSSGKPVWGAVQKHPKNDPRFKNVADFNARVAESIAVARELDKLWIGGELVMDRLGDGGTYIRRGQPIKLVSPEGTDMGKACILDHDTFMVLEDPMDIRIGKEFWFLAGQFEDPVVAHGAVDHYCISHGSGWIKPRTKLRMKTDNGYIAECYDTDLHPTREAAETARMKQLEDEQ